MKMVLLHSAKIAHGRLVFWIFGGQSTVPPLPSSLHLDGAKTVADETTQNRYYY